MTRRRPARYVVVRCDDGNGRATWDVVDTRADRLTVAVIVANHDTRREARDDARERNAARTEYRNGNPLRLVATGCDGCSPCSVNGILCHEAGCPDAWRDAERDCFACGFPFRPWAHDDGACPDCVRQSIDDALAQEGRHADE